jgi:hypothetical protein
MHGLEDPSSKQKVAVSLSKPPTKSLLSGLISLLLFPRSLLDLNIASGVDMRKVEHINYILYDGCT